MDEEILTALLVTFGKKPTPMLINVLRRLVSTVADDAFYAEVRDYLQTTVELNTLLNTAVDTVERIQHVSNCQRN